MVICGLSPITQDSWDVLIYFFVGHDEKPLTRDGHVSPPGTGLGSGYPKVKQIEGAGYRPKLNFHGLCQYTNLFSMV